METYKFELRDKEKNRLQVYVNFVINSIGVGDRDKARSVHYCTILVRKCRDYKYYHGGVVVSPSDRYNEKTGMFKAFQDALFRRWLDAGDGSWETYRLHWCHFLQAVMDGKTIDNPNML